MRLSNFALLSVAGEGNDTVYHGEVDVQTSFLFWGWTKRRKVSRPRDGHWRFDHNGALTPGYEVERLEFRMTKAELENNPNVLT